MGSTGWRSFGVVPWLREAALLPSEDSVILERISRGGEVAFKVAVPMLSRIANFDILYPSVSPRRSTSAKRLGHG